MHKLQNAHEHRTLAQDLRPTLSAQRLGPCLLHVSARAPKALAGPGLALGLVEAWRALVCVGSLGDGLASCWAFV